VVVLDAGKYEEANNRELCAWETTVFVGLIQNRDDKQIQTLGDLLFLAGLRLNKVHILSSEIDRITAARQDVGRVQISQNETYQTQD
jgi:hypothetical protein